MQKGSAQLLLIFIILLFLASGLYFLQRSQKNESSQVTPYKNYDNYKIYSDNTLGFEFKYDKDLKVKEDSEEEYNKRGNGDFRKNFKGYVGYEPGKFLGAVVVLDKSQNYDASTLSIWIFNNDNNLTIKQWFQNYWYYPYLWGVFDWSSKEHVTPDKEATISGQVAKYKVVGYQPGKPKYLYISKDQKMYLFRMLGETGDKILATFKFLK